MRSVQDEAPSSGSDVRIRRAALLVSVLASFLTPFMGSSVNIALPAIGREFNLTAVSLGWIATAYLLAAAVFLVSFGRLADIVGRKKIFSLGLVVYTAASLLSALSLSAPMLIAGRLAQGLGAAMIFATGVAILSSVYPPGSRGKALGINTAAVYLGLSLGPVLGGFLVQNFGWRSIFWVNVPLGLAALAYLGARLEGEWAEAKGERFDVWGAVAYGLGLAAFMYGFSRLPSWPAALLAAAGIMLLAAFAVWETRTTAPLLDVRLFLQNRVFAFSNLAALINYSATYAAGFLLSLYLQYNLGFGPQAAGLILIIRPLIMAACSPAAGRISDRIEPRILASAGMGLSAAGLGVFAFLGPGSSTAFLAFGLALLGLGFGLFASPNTNAIMGSVKRRHFGVAAAALGTMRLTGQMLSLGITTTILSVIMGRVPVSVGNLDLLLRSVRTAFAVFAVLCVAGMLASLARGNRGADAEAAIEAGIREDAGGDESRV